MPRALYLCALSASLLGAASARAGGPTNPPPPAQPQPVSPSAPSTTSSGPASPSIAPQLVDEARAMLPAPLLYGRFQPQVGAFVEYEVSNKQGKTRVRAAVVGKTQRPTGEPLYQVEFLYPDTQPRVLVVLWLIGDKRPLVDRLAMAAGTQSPISIPVDLYTDLPELRGTPSPETEAQVKAGPFAGGARQRGYTVGKDVFNVVTSDKVPLFGVETVRGPQETWVARKAGTGVGPELTTVPMAVPRMPTVK